MTHNPVAALSGHALAVRAERIDTDAWFDQWAAAPAGARYVPAGQWDRVVFQGAAVRRWARLAADCEPVTRKMAPEWAGCIRACHGMPPLIGKWLMAEVDRPGWIHALRCEGGRWKAGS